MKHLTLTIMIFFLIACQSSFDMHTTVKNASGKTYYMVSPYKDTQITININNNKINGFASVNRYFGTIDIINNSIKISNISRTKMAGQDRLMKIEEDYIKSLEATSKIHLKGKELRLGNMKFIEK